jgi:hypothetical protein
MIDFARGVWGQQGRTDAKERCKGQMQRGQGEDLQKLVIFRSRDDVSHGWAMDGSRIDHGYIIDGPLTVLSTLFQQVGSRSNMS